MRHRNSRGLNSDDFSQSENADVVLPARNIDYHESLHPAEAYGDPWVVYAEGTV